MHKVTLQESQCAYLLGPGVSQTSGGRESDPGSPYSQTRAYRMKQPAEIRPERAWKCDPSDHVPSDLYRPKIGSHSSLADPLMVCQDTKSKETYRVIVGMHTMPNLCNHLVRAKFHHQIGEPARHKSKWTPAGKLVTGSGKLVSSATGNRYTAKYSVNCQSSNLYCLQWIRCSKQYVGILPKTSCNHSKRDLPLQTSQAYKATSQSQL